MTVCFLQRVPRAFELRVSQQVCRDVALAQEQRRNLPEDLDLEEGVIRARIHVHGYGHGAPCRRCRQQRIQIARATEVQRPDLALRPQHLAS